MAKTSMNLFTNVILDEYREQGISVKVKNNPVYFVSPLQQLSSDQEENLNDGDGQASTQYKQINSSAGLAVNYYKLLENTGLITDLVFENKVAIPLKNGGRCANLDVSYKRNCKMYFVESKFLEPYYSGNEVIKDSYLDISRYPVEVENHHAEWHSLFMASSEFVYYNFSQMCRHLLALYRYSHGMNGSDYNNEPIILQSVTWRMTDAFFDRLSPENRDEVKCRINAIEEETGKANCIINDFIKQIGWKNMDFETLHYNDMLKDIESTTKYDEFCKRYFL